VRVLRSASLELLSVLCGSPQPKYLFRRQLTFQKVATSHINPWNNHSEALEWELLIDKHATPFRIGDHMRRITAYKRPALLAVSLAGTLLYILAILRAEATEPAPVLSSALSAQSGAPDIDLGKLHAHARVVYVSSGAKTLAVRMIDGDGRTAFRFSESDLHPTVIIELAQNEKLHRVTAAFPAEAARLDVYLTTDLPKDRNDLQFLKPVASVVGFNGDGKAVVDFAPQEARYVALRWTRHEPGGKPFKVTEISAFGGVGLSFADVDLGTPLSINTMLALPTIPVVSPE
jgi:hypothetical protein